MKMQTSTMLALYSVLEAASNPDKQVSAAEIAEHYGVSAHHLAKVLRELGRAGLVVDRIDFRGQLFAALMIRIPGGVARLMGRRGMVAFGLLDWRLFRRLPNGATMLVSAHRPPAAGRS